MTTPINFHIIEISAPPDPAGRRGTEHKAERSAMPILVRYYCFECETLSEVKVPADAPIGAQSALSIAEHHLFSRKCSGASVVLDPHNNAPLGGAA